MNGAHRTRWSLAPLALLLTGTAAVAQPAPDGESSDDASVFAGVELGNTDTRRLEAGGQFNFARRWQASLQAARAEFELPEDDLSSTLAVAKLQYDFGAWGLGAGLRRAEVSDLSRNEGAFLAAFFDHETLRFSAEIELRDTELAPSPFTEDLGGGAGVQSGISRCTVDSIGYQAQVTLDRPSWSGFVSARGFDYADYDCLLTLDGNGGGNGNGNGNGPPAHARGRALGRRLGEQPLAPVTGFASRLIPREAILLQSSLAVGASMPIDAHWLGGVELYRDSERVGGSHYDTALAFAMRQLNDSWTLELTVGFSDAEMVEDTTFAGVRMTLNL